MLLANANSEQDFEAKLQIPVETKPLILFAGSQWDDASSTSQASLFRTLKSVFLDLFSGQEVSSADVASLQHLLIIATGEPTSESGTQSAQTPIPPGQVPVIHLRWYKLRTLRSSDPKTPRLEVDPMGPSFDFRIGRYREAEDSMMKDALKKTRPPHEPRSKKNVEMGLVGDKIGRVHLGRQDLSTLQTRKMKGLKRGREVIESDGADGVLTNGHAVPADAEIDEVSMDEVPGNETEFGEDESQDGGMKLIGQLQQDDDDLDSLEFIDEDDEENAADAMPKRQRVS